MLSRMVNSLYLFYFKWKLKRRGCVVARGSSISSTDFFEGNNYISGRVIDSFIGYGTYISDRCFLRNCRVGRFCSIAPDVKILRGTHPTTGFVSTSPAFYLRHSPVGKSYVDCDLFNTEKRCSEDPQYEVVIGNDVWIGQQVLLMQGINVGNGAIIAAGSVVIEDVPPYAIVAGVPAKIKKYRFSEEQIAALQNIKWWERDEKWIAEHAYMFSDIDIFLKGMLNDK